ncbi:hypothetical protein MTR67_007147 [Solanum verrucosum]|uniref:Transposase n=1 Tax=Solanum verrucosum TaxID=315347 RepID=A0AAF0TAB9_SOLVR|nr:hypothetical protein MTR67_007147 [Solanum verrucosum]
MCNWEARYNMVIVTTFERRASARISNWLEKVWDTDQCPGWILPHVFDELHQYWNTNKFKAMSEQAKKARGSLKGGSLKTGGAKTVGTITIEMDQMTPGLSTQIWTEKVVDGTHKGRVYGRASQNNIRRLQSGLQRIGSLCQAEAVDDVQIAAMSAQIASLHRHWHILSGEV